MMTELGFVERPVLDWLSGRRDRPDDHGLGWTYRDEEQMEKFGRRLDDPIVEPLLINALKFINHHRGLKTDEQARMAVEVLRATMDNPDLLAANRNTLDLLRDGVPLVLEQGQPPVTVQFIEFDPAKEELNDFTVTNQYKVKGVAGVRADTVLLVNGIPLVVAEFKNFATSGDWIEGHKQLHRYQRSAPQFLVPNVFSVAADDQEFRYGTVLFKQDVTDDEIKLHVDNWRPWLSQYPVRKGYWNLPPHEQDFDKVHAAVEGLLRPCNVLDFLQHFVVFETKRGETTKKLARYQQFEAANEFVDRVVSLFGEDVGRQDRTGLVWHTQGSGKTLTMIYGGYKLRRHPRLQNPTVLIVVDRRDLKTQLSDDFENCDYPSVVKALGVDDLKDKIRSDRRETIVTTIQCFQHMEDLPPNERDGIICLIDEAHRSQKGKGAGYAVTMRAKLPEAFRFGFTGTPIDKTMVNTHRDFGPITNGKQERYLSLYSNRQAIKDGATLEVAYQYCKVPLAIDEKPLSIGYEQMCEEMEIEDEEEKDFYQRREARWKALATHPDRLAKIISHMVDHFVTHPDPSGFKAQLVTIDRKACVTYKNALDAEFKKRGLPVECSEVVISAAQNDPPELERYHYSREQTDEIIDWFKLTPTQYQQACTKKFGPDRTRWKPPLKILIVCDRLLTGFDAPIEQVMYLDKPLRDHNLLQAIARTNRPMPEMDKRNGLIIDYFGVFADLQKALNFNENEIEDAVINWEKLKALMPQEIEQCMKPFAGIEIEDTRDCLLACLRRLVDSDKAHEFESQFKRTEVLWEAISPDESLYPLRHKYAWLCGIYIAHKRRNRRSMATAEELAAKTRQLIKEHTAFFAIAEDIPVYKIDANYLVKVRALPTPADKAAELEAALNRELVEQGGFVYKQLGDRLQTLKEQKDSSDKTAETWLRELEGLVAQVNDARAEPERLGLSARGEYPLFTVIRTFAKAGDEKLFIRTAKSMIAQLEKKNLLPEGWPDNPAGRKNVSLAIQVESWEPEFEPLGLCPPDQNDPPFLAAAVEELGRAMEK